MACLSEKKLITHTQQILTSGVEGDAIKDAKQCLA